MRDYTPRIRRDTPPLPYFPPVEFELDVSDTREPTPPFLLLSWRQRSEIERAAELVPTLRIGDEMDEAFLEADAIPDQPSRARERAGKLVFAVIIGGIVALFGYEIASLGGSSAERLHLEFRGP